MRSINTTGITITGIRIPQNGGSHIGMCGDLTLPLIMNINPINAITENKPVYEVLPILPRILLRSEGKLGSR